MRLGLNELQETMKPWVKHNFGDRPSHQPLLGVAEEVGELCHAHLKQEQGIRVNEDQENAGRDAVGDILIYLADYCNDRKWDMEEILFLTWEHVSKRDWKANPATGVK